MKIDNRILQKLLKNIRKTETKWKKCTKPTIFSCWLIVPVTSITITQNFAKKSLIFNKNACIRKTDFWFWGHKNTDWYCRGPFWKISTISTLLWTLLMLKSQVTHQTPQATFQSLQLSRTQQCSLIKKTVSCLRTGRAYSPHFISNDKDIFYCYIFR